MKKLLILGLVLLMVVVFATTVFGKAQKEELDIYDAYIGGPEQPEEASGWVILNLDANNNLIVQIQVRDLKPNTQYWAWSQGEQGSFWTNAKGHGHFHFSRPYDEYNEDYDIKYDGLVWIAIRTEDHWEQNNKVLQYTPPQ
jgi:hypothetical protein